MDNTARVIDITELEQKDTEIEQKALQIIDVRTPFLVVDKETLSLADVLTKKCLQAIKEIDDEYQPISNSAFNHHRNITAKWNARKKPYVDFKDELKRQVVKYRAEEDRKRQEEERRLREIARKEEEERRLLEAEELEREGRKEEAEAILEEPITFVAPTVQVEMPRVDGRLYRTTTKVKVKNRLLFLKGVPAEILLECINESAWGTIENALARKAKALGSAFKMQGVEVYQA